MTKRVSDGKSHGLSPITQLPFGQSILFVWPAGQWLSLRVCSMSAHMAVSLYGF